MEEKIAQLSIVAKAQGLIVKKVKLLINPIRY
jgi:hypothetical protein